MKQEIENWLNSERDFNEGIRLLFRYGKNRNLPHNIEGNSKRYAGKLLYELAKLAGYSFEDLPKLRERKISKPKKQTKIIPIKSNITEKKNKYPEIVEKLITETQSVYNERALLHKQLVNLPDENTKEIIDKRKELIELIAKCTIRFEILYQAKEDYFQRDIMPDPDKLWEKSDIKKKKNEENDGAKLMKKKKNLESSLSKDRNLLLYQEKTKQQKENPMPDGDYKKRIEKRIKRKEKELQEINLMLNI